MSLDLRLGRIDSLDRLGRLHRLPTLLEHEARRHQLGLLIPQPIALRLYLASPCGQGVATRLVLPLDIYESLPLRIHRGLEPLELPLPPFHLRYPRRKLCLKGRGRARKRPLEFLGARLLRPSQLRLPPVQLRLAHGERDLPVGKRGLRERRAGHAALP
jgi:hypothetical protein